MVGKYVQPYQFPARGRKRFAFFGACVFALVWCPTLPIPRKGTETTYPEGRRFATTDLVQPYQFPARGRKLLLILIFLLKSLLYCVQPYQFPARGRKLLYRLKEVYAIFSPTLPIPRKGTETLKPILFSSNYNNKSPTLPIPRKGTETFSKS